MSMAKTISGLSKGANPTNQACGFFLLDHCAVPVFPATGTGRDCKLLALPDKTVFVRRRADGVQAGSGGESADIDLDAASHIFVHRL